MCSRRAHADGYTHGDGTGQPQPHPLDVVWVVASGMASRSQAQRLAIRGLGVHPCHRADPTGPGMRLCGEGQPAGRVAGDRGDWALLWVQLPPWRWAGARRGGWKHH